MRGIKEKAVSKKCLLTYSNSHISEIQGHRFGESLSQESRTNLVILHIYEKRYSQREQSIRDSNN
jgi:hypothetical protein